MVNFTYNSFEKIRFLTSDLCLNFHLKLSLTVATEIFYLNYQENNKTVLLGFILWNKKFELNYICNKKESIFS